MEEKTIHIMKEYLAELREKRSLQERRITELRGASNLLLKACNQPSGKRYYCAMNRADYKLSYLGKDNYAKIDEIRERRYLEKSLKVINCNIDSLEKALSKICMTDYDTINNLLPKTYRGAKLGAPIGANDRARIWKERAEALKARYDVFRKEELNIRTDDGNYVRSKSEAMIYNELLSKGVTFIYEMPFNLGGRTVYPDFVLLSEIDYRTEIIIEHQGLMSNEVYRKRFNDKLYNYLCNGYVQGINIFYTFDTINGGFDKTPITHIVNTHIKNH